MVRTVMRTAVWQRSYARMLVLPLVLLAGCAIRSPLPDTPWPEDIPQREWFEARYAADPANQAVQRRGEYLRWVVRFYYGWLAYPDGWNDVTARVAAAAGEGEAGEMRRRMNFLGRRLAAEWAKDSPARVIRNRALAAWGEGLRIAADRGEIPGFLERVAADTDALFAGRLEPESITVSRYYAGADEPLPFER